MRKLTARRQKKISQNRPRIMLKYFFRNKGFIYSGLILLLIAVALLLVALLVKDMDDKIRLGLYIGAGVVALLALLEIIISSAKKPNFQDIEYLIGADRELAYSGLFDHLALTNHRGDYIDEPIELVRPELYPGRNTTLYRYDKKSKKIYFSQTGYNWLMFGKKSFGMYHVIVNHILGLVGYESADEIGYSDIVDVKTETVVEEAYSKNKGVAFKRFMHKRAVAIGIFCALLVLGIAGALVSHFALKGNLIGLIVSGVVALVSIIGLIVSISLRPDFNAGLEVLRLTFSLINGQSFTFNLRYSVPTDESSTKLNEQEKAVIARIRNIVRDNK